MEESARSLFTVLNPVSFPFSKTNVSSETQGFKWGRERKGETGRGKKGGGRGGEGKGERGSPGKLLYTEHFSIEEQPLARC